MTMEAVDKSQCRGLRRVGFDGDRSDLAYRADDLSQVEGQNVSSDGERKTYMFSVFSFAR